MAAEKAKLLQSLRLERPDAVQTAVRRRRLPLLVAVAVSLVAAIGLLGPFATQFTVDRQDAGVAATTTSPASAPTVRPEPQSARGLVASGYVVARRKATVAAEITGKVVEVLIDERMVVNKGDVVARLDSVLAERDLALARSRADAAEAAIGAIAADLRDAERIWSRNRSSKVSSGEITSSRRCVHASTIRQRSMGSSAMSIPIRASSSKRSRKQRTSPSRPHGHRT